MISSSRNMSKNLIQIFLTGLAKLDVLKNVQL